MKTIIIGGVAGGATCAARLRRLKEDMNITIYEKSSYISYANCGLPYYLGNVIKNKKSLTLQNPKSFKSRYNVDVFVKHEVIEINKDKKEVIVKNLDTNDIFKDKYDKLVIATGAKAVIPNIEGKELGFTLKTVEDAYLIEDYIIKNKVKDVIVVGGGFIGLEVLENLKLRGLDVTLVERTNQVLNPIDLDMATYLHKELSAKGVKLKLESNILGLFKENGKIKAKFDNDELYTDLVIFALGVEPLSSLGEKALLNLGIKNSIVVNKYLETSDKDIYACGDVIEIRDILKDRKTLISLAGPANKQARVIANNICDIEEEYKGALNTSILKLFDLNVAFVGFNEKELKASNIGYDKIYISPNDHASYYPDPSELNIKVLFNKDYEILGGVVVGKNGVDKKIDILTMAIYNKMKLYDLKNIDFSYAPPFNSAKDPINMLGFIADNLKRGIVKHYFIEDIEGLLNKKDIILLDVRTKEEYESCHIKGYINISVDELRNNLSRLDKSKKVYVMCHSGIRSYIACRILSQAGFDVYNLSGGFRFYYLIFYNKANNYFIYKSNLI